MRLRHFILACVLAASWVSGELDVSSSGISSADTPTDVPNHPNPKPLVVAKPTQPMRMNVPPVPEISETKTEEAKVDSPVMEPMQVTGFITANGSIYEVQDKNGMGQIEARQNGELLTPQPGEFICNYGSVVLYSDMPCEQIVEAQKPVTMDIIEQKVTMEKPMKTMKIEKESSAVDIQADENSDVMEHKENNSRVGESVGNVANRKKSKKPGRKGGNKKSKKQSNRQSQNNKMYVVTRRRYKIPLEEQVSQQQQQQQQQLQPLQEQTLVQQQQPQKQQQNIKSQRRPQTASNRRRQQQQQKRRLQQLRQQQRRRLQQSSAYLEVNNKQRYISPDGLVYEIVHVNEN